MADPTTWFSGPLSAGISSAAGLLGGFMNRGLSQRDAMQAQMEFAYENWKRQLLAGPTKEIAGLRRAGVNPMLAYAKGGAGPNASFAMPSIAPPINPGMDIQRALSSGVTSAIDLYRAEGQVEQMGAAVRKMDKEIGKIDAEIAKINADTSLSEEQRKLAISNQHKAFAEEVLAFARANLTKDESDHLRANIAVLQSQEAINAWRALSEEAHARLSQAGVPRAEADEEFWDTLYGRFLRWVEHSKDAINPFGSSGVGGPVLRRR